MTHVFCGEHFLENDDGSIQFRPNQDVYDYEILQGLFEAERNIGALARHGLKDHPLKPTSFVIQWLELHISQLRLNKINWSLTK